MSRMRAFLESARARRGAWPKGAPDRTRSRPSLADSIGAGKGLAVIAEFKRRSPSRGILGRRDARESARVYAAAGARAVSVVTEPRFFGGSAADLETVSDAVSVPVLMKDFVIDPEPIRAAALLGASAALLVLRAVDLTAQREIEAAAREYGVELLTECKDRGELERAVSGGAWIIGVNNRDLETLCVDLDTAPRLLSRIPPGSALRVAESGYRRAADATRVAAFADAVLIGTALMTSPFPARLIEEVATCASRSAV